MKNVHPSDLFARNTTDGSAMMCSVLSIGNHQGMGHVGYGKFYG